MTAEERNELRRAAPVIGRDGGHEWIDPAHWGSEIPGVFCRKCLVMRRRDGKNGKCRGPAKLRL